MLVQSVQEPRGSDQVRPPLHAPARLQQHNDNSRNRNARAAARARALTCPLEKGAPTTPTAARGRRASCRSIHALLMLSDECPEDLHVTSRVNQSTLGSSLGCATRVSDPFSKHQRNASIQLYYFIMTKGGRGLIC